MKFRRTYINPLRLLAMSKRGAGPKRNRNSSSGGDVPPPKQPATAATAAEAVFPPEQAPLDPEQFPTTFEGMKARYLFERDKWFTDSAVKNSILLGVNAECQSLRAEKTAWLEREQALLAENAQLKQQKRTDRGSEQLALQARRLNVMLWGVDKQVAGDLVLAKVLEVVPGATDVQLVALPCPEGQSKRPYKLLCGSMATKTALLQAQVKLNKATGYRVDLDLTPAQQAARKAQKPLADRVKVAGGFWFFKGTALRVRTGPKADEDATTWLAKQGGGGAPAGEGSTA